MDAEYDIFEIVTVICDFWLVDAESYQRRFCRRHGQSLAPGHYVVNWPEHIQARRFNEHAAFHGPFKLRNEAQAALARMRQQREYVVNRPAEKTFVAALVPSRTPVEKTAGQGTRPS